jgi:hypothetical protein
MSSDAINLHLNYEYDIDWLKAKKQIKKHKLNLKRLS